MITAEQIPEAVAHAAESAWSKDATWKEVVAEVLNACDVVELVRKETLKVAAAAIREAAKASPYAKGRTQEFIYGLQDGYEAAAQVAIRKLGEE
jgi:hypothetical protein